MTRIQIYIKQLIPLYFLFIVIGFLPVQTTAQDRCGSVEYELRLKKSESKQEFEDWLQGRINQKINQPKAQRRQSTEGIMQIPVVVHIIHNGEGIGNGSNISDEQIISQIEVLNEDFRRTNADQINTPADFLPVASDTEVEFVLAKRDPEGLATDGIVRVEGSQSSWTMNDNVTMKALSYWPAEDYLNMWVAPLSFPLLGYAQFPVSNLEGLEDASGNRLTDGVVLDYEAFGSISKYPQAKLKSGLDLGRTTTHEVGHFLGLRHIWGDGDCTKDDFCNDTPMASSSHNGLGNCSYPGDNTCDEGAGDLPDMFQNYMDYTDDACMNLFTADQKTRIITVLSESPRRKSLTISLGGTEPIIYTNDIGLFEIITPGTYACGEETIPQVIVKNYGNTTVTEVSIQASLDGVAGNVMSFPIMLEYLESTTLDLTTLPIVNSIDHVFEVEIVGVNNSIDDNDLNNHQSRGITATPSVDLPLSESLNDFPDLWEIENPDGATGWATTHLAYKTTGDNSIYLDYYNYEIEGEMDWFISPLLDLSNSSVATLTFEVAHAQYTGAEDRLKVMVSTDCGNTFLESNTIYNKAGSELATTSSQSSQFAPTSSDQWRLEQLDLSPFAGEMVRIAFIGVNDYGNDIYLDNINITGQTSMINTPYPVSGITSQTLGVDVFNANSDSIKNLTISYSLNNNVIKNININNVNIAPGQVSTFVVDRLEASLGLNTIYLQLSSVDGPIETGLEENEISYSFIIDDASDIIPLKEDFNATSPWIGINPVDSEITWESVVVNDGDAKFVNSYDHSTTPSNAWLVSPLLDLSDNTAASMFFDISYASSDKGSGEKLTLLISTDDGLTYPDRLYIKSGDVLATHELLNNWIPKMDGDWRTEFIDLSSYAGKEKIRVAFVLENNYGNNLYLDNIEFFIDNNPEPVDIFDKQVYAYPNPIKTGEDPLELVFNLEERQQVEIVIYDRLGKRIYEGQLQNALNQHFTFELEDFPTGLFILSVRGDTFHHTQRLVVIR